VLQVAVRCQSPYAQKCIQNTVSWGFGIDDFFFHILLVKLVRQPNTIRTITLGLVQTSLDGVSLLQRFRVRAQVTLCRACTITGCDRIIRARNVPREMRSMRNRRKLSALRSVQHGAALADYRKLGRRRPPISDAMSAPRVEDAHTETPSHAIEARVICLLCYPPLHASSDISLLRKPITLFFRVDPRVPSHLEVSVIVVLLLPQCYWVRSPTSR